MRGSEAGSLLSRIFLVGAAVQMTTACAPCPPGERRFLPCSSDPRRICLACPPNTFSSNYSLSDECEYCRNYCLRVNEVIVANCTSRMDTVCHCRPGTWLRSEDDPVCVPHTKCPKGYGVEQLGTRRSDTVCEKCEHGYYSDVSSASEPCRPLTKCRETGVKVAGDDVTDNLCHPAASTEDDQIVPDYAIAIIVISAVVILALVVLVHLFQRRRAVIRRSVVMSVKGCIVQQPREPRPSAPPAYGEVTLNDLSAVQGTGTAAAPLLTRGVINIEADDVNQNILEEFEKLNYKTCPLPGNGSSAATADVIQEVFIELSHSVQTYYIPFFQRLPGGFSPEELSYLQAMHADRGLQHVLLHCFDTWFKRVTGADLAIDHLLQTLRHEEIAAHETADRIQRKYDEAKRPRHGYNS